MSDIEDIQQFRIPEYLNDTASLLDELPISSEDVKIARQAALEATNGILWGDSNFVMSIRSVMVDQLQVALDLLPYPRQLNYRDIEQSIVFLRKYFEEKWHNFRDFDYVDPLWNKDEYELLFARKIMQVIIEKYLSSFPTLEKNTRAWKWKTEKDGLKPLPPKLANILNCPALEELLMTLTKKGMIKVSDNISNTFTKEIEQKVLEVDRMKLINDLDEMEWVEKRFEWYVTDTYYDFPDGRLENEESTPKSSFRIRKKEDKKTWKISYFYTVKRKDKASTDFTWVRDCWEEEFEITKTDVRYVEDILKSFGMHEFKTKEKYRVSYQHKARGVKFDIDDYKGIPTFLEIEAEKLDDLEEFKKTLWIDNVDVNPTFNSWTTKLHKHYEVPYPKYDARVENPTEK